MCCYVYIYIFYRNSDGGRVVEGGCDGDYYYDIFYLFILGIVVKAPSSQSGNLSSKPLTGFIVTSTSSSSQFNSISAMDS